MNPKTFENLWGSLEERLGVELHEARVALERIAVYGDPPNGPAEMTHEQLQAAFNAVREIARRALPLTMHR